MALCLLLVRTTMPDTSLYRAPRNPILRWLAEIGGGLPDETQRRLRSMFFTSKVPLVIGAVNTIVVALVIYAHNLQPIFLGIAVCDIALLLFRVASLKRVDAPAGPLFAGGLLWACLQGLTIFLVVSSGDLTLSLLVLASGLAAIGGIVGRNFPAPRYAIVQTLLIDGSYKIAFSLQHPQFIPLIAAQTVIFIVMNLGIIRQHRETAIGAIRAEFENREKAFTDPVTGLASRWRLEDCFARMRPPTRGRALLYLDLDGFKQVNDRLGHAAGDHLLREVGQRLSEFATPDSVICRLGGDEFLILLKQSDETELRHLCARVLARIATPYEIAPGSLARVGVSIGTVIDRTGDQTLIGLMLKADRALYEVKAGGKGAFRIHEEPPHEAPALRCAAGQ